MAVVGWLYLQGNTLLMENNVALELAFWIGAHIIHSDVSWDFIACSYAPSSG
jgi:hypothetical protein